MTILVARLAVFIIAKWQKRNAKNENANEVLSKIGLASRELIDKMSDIVWSLNPNNESFEQLQNRMMALLR
jgi:hypothetical protein